MFWFKLNTISRLMGNDIVTQSLTIFIQRQMMNLNDNGIWWHITISKARVKTWLLFILEGDLSNSKWNARILIISCCKIYVILYTSDIDMIYLFLKQKYVHQVIYSWTNIIPVTWNRFAGSPIKMYYLLFVINQSMFSLLLSNGR